MTITLSFTLEELREIVHDHINRATDFRVAGVAHEEGYVRTKNFRVDQHGIERIATGVTVEVEQKKTRTASK